MREAVLKRFELRLNHGVNVKMRNVRVVKDSQRHVVHLMGNPFRVTLVGGNDKGVIAYSEDLGICAVLKGLPAFIERLLA